MKLLIITQAVDLNNPVLGFFHRWIEEFAKYCDRLTVICLERGEHQLSPEIRVLSLGKETGHSNLKYFWRFYKYIWRERKNYDAVFVHMNQEYVLLAGWWWRLAGKKIMMWRNHARGNVLTRLAIALTHRVFCTSVSSFTARFKKTQIMPVGIDVDFFKSDLAVVKKPHSVLFLGRIAPVKNVTLFMETLNELQKLGIEFSATIAGGALPIDAGYEKMVRSKVAQYGLESKVKFVGAVTQEAALRLYREHELYVNLTPPGSMDKTIFEAMACGTLVVVDNQAVMSDLDRQLLACLDLSETIKAERRQLNRQIVVEQHSLAKLVESLVQVIHG